MDTGAERIADATDLATARRQATRVNVKTVLLALLLTALAMAIPGR